MATSRLLLGSGGLRTPERLERWRQACDAFLGNCSSVLFIPYALKNHDGYVSRMREIDFHAGREVVGLHTQANPHEAIAKAQAISVGGGNTFRLLAELQRQGLLPLIREKVLSGTPYMGVSAGSNLACPTIKTTNDMPIVAPSSLEALGLIPFQINPHYFPGRIYYKTDAGDMDVYAGETREDRIREYHEMNLTPVLGLYEGSTLRIDGTQVTLLAHGRARLFCQGQSAKPINAADKDLTLDIPVA